MTMIVGTIKFDENADDDVVMTTKMNTTSRTTMMTMLPRKMKMKKAKIKT